MLECHGAASCGVWYADTDLVAARTELEDLLFAAEGSLPGVVPDPTNEGTRSIYGVHRLRPAFDVLARDERVRAAAQAVLGEPVYLYQSKLNPKEPGAAGWHWHVDFQPWALNDGMREPRAVTFGINLDDVSADSGPFTALLGSHHQFGSWSMGESKPVGNGGGSSEWLRDFGIDLKYPLSAELVTRLSAECVAEPFTGPTGAVVAFMGATVHCSPGNTSGVRRAVLYLTFNAESNRPDPARMTRPQFIAEH